MEWCDPISALRILPKSEKLPDKPFARLVAIFQDQGVILMPLTWVALMGADKENSADVLARAGRCLDDNPENSVWQVLAYDGFVDLNSGRVEAIIVMLRTYNQNPIRLKIAFSYTPAKFLRLFKILDPTLRESNIPDEGVELLGSTMQRGIQSVKWAFGKTWDKLRG